MQEIFNQLSELVLGSLPTIAFFLVLIAAYTVLVRQPLERVLADRHSRTGGAMDEARAAIAAAETKTADYELKLRTARVKIFEGRQARQKASSDARDKALAQAREQAQHRIGVARESVEQSGLEARQQIEASVATLSASIVAAILPGRSQTGAAK